MSDVYDIPLYPLQDWSRTVNKMSAFMSTGNFTTGNFMFCPVNYTVLKHSSPLHCLSKELMSNSPTKADTVFHCPR